MTVVHQWAGLAGWDDDRPFNPGGLNEQFARDLDAAGTYRAVQLGLDAVLARIMQK